MVQSYLSNFVTLKYSVPSAKFLAKVPITMSMFLQENQQQKSVVKILTFFRESLKS